MPIDLTAVSIQLHRYIMGGIFLFGTIGSISNSIIFTNKNLHLFPCSLYYFTQSIICFLLLYTTILLRYFSEGFQLDLPARSSFTCKFYLYTSSVFRSLSALFILWASIDRYLVSSSSERLRRLSQVKYAIYTICLTIITIVILFIYVPIYFGASPALTLTCSPNGHGTLTVAHTLLGAFISVLFVPLMLICFSILTVKNVQRRRRLVHTANTAARKHQNTHMTRLILSQSFIYLILVAPSSIFNLYFSFISSQTSAQLLFTYKLLFLLQFVHPASAFYINTLVSRTYRQEAIKVLDNVVKRVFHSAMLEPYILQNRQPHQEQRHHAILNARNARQMETKF